MAKTIPQLTDATTVNAADELIIQQGGITKRATGAELAKGLNAINGTVNVKDFGAVGDGVADDTAAFQGILNLNGRITCHVPRGSYLLNSSPTIGTATDVKWIFDTGAEISGVGALPFTPQKIQLNGAPVISTVPQISLLQGNSSNPKTNLDKKTPALYIERHTSSNPADSSDWGNPRNSSPVEIENIVYGSETGSQHSIIGRVFSATAKAVGSAFQSLVSASFLAQSNAPSGQNNRDCWAINAIVASSSGTAPDNLVGIEVDCIPSAAMPDLRPGEAGAKNVTAYWAQAASAVANCNTGLYISSTDSVYGWLYGMVADAPFYRQLGYFRNSINAPTARGIRIETTWAADDGRVLECFVAGTQEQLRVDGNSDDAVSIRVGGALKKIVAGSPNSGGAGFRSLIVAN